MATESSIAVPAGLIGEPARAAMLEALLDGRSLPAGELARIAQVRPSTASEHLQRLTAAGMVTAVRLGRHRYFTLASPEVAAALEALQNIAPAPRIRSLRAANTSKAMAYARSCYDHIAGELALSIADTLVSGEVIDPLRPGEISSVRRPEHTLLAELGVPPRLPASKRPAVRGCLDWTERRPHVAGQLGAVILDSLVQNRWIARSPRSRALRVTDLGRERLERLGA